MKKAWIAIIATSCFLISCSSHHKKLLIFASNDVKVDDAQKKVVVAEGTTHHEKELEWNNGDPVTLSLQGPKNNYTANIGTDGYYVANLKPDTLIGSLQRVGAAERSNRISQEEMKRSLDSLQQLIAGRTESFKGKSYFVPPGSTIKISNQVNVKVFGPYLPIPSAFDASPFSEVYKFYTSDEVREIIGKLVEATKPDDEEAPKKK